MERVSYSGIIVHPEFPNAATAIMAIGRRIWDEVVHNCLRDLFLVAFAGALIGGKAEGVRRRTVVEDTPKTAL